MTDELTADQREALTILQEEAAEVIHAVSKILRHGLFSANPDGDGSLNIEVLKYEVAQFMAMLAVVDATDAFVQPGVDEHSIAERAMVAKLESLRKYSDISDVVLDRVMI